MKNLFADKPRCTMQKPLSVEYIYLDRLKKTDITFKKMVSGKSRSVGNTRTKAKMAKRQEKWHSSAVQAEFTFRRSD